MNRTINLIPPASKQASSGKLSPLKNWMGGRLRKLGPRALVTLIIYYLIRDLTLYVALPLIFTM